MAAHVLLRALVGELRARTAGRPTPPSATPLPLVVQRELHTEWQVKARGSAILYFTFNRRYTETRDSLRGPWLCTQPSLLNLESRTLMSLSATAKPDEVEK